MTNSIKKLELHLERWLFIIESEMLETFWFVRMDEGEMWKNEIWNS